MSKTSHIRLVYAVAIFGGLLFVIHLLIFSQALSDGNHINPNVNSSQWQADGVLITVLDGRQNQLQNGDLVTAVEGIPIQYWLDDVFCPLAPCRNLPVPELTAGTQLSYTIVRDGEQMTATATLRPYPFWELLRRSWGAFAFPLASYLLFFFLLIRRPEENSVIALILAASGLLGSMGWAFGHDIVGIFLPARFWLYRFATEVVYWPSVIGVLHFMLVFPRPIPFVQRRRWLLVAIYPAAYVIYAGLLITAALSTDNTLLWMATTFGSQSVVVTPYYLLAFLALLLNYRSLTEEYERQQVRIVILTTGLVTLLSAVIRSLPAMLFGESLVASNEMAIVALIVPISIVFAVLRNRLWGIDIIINRTLVFTSASAVIVGFYIVLVSAIGRLLQTGTNSLSTSLIATGIIAVMFQPLRLRLQQLVNRAMYGERDDPAAVLTRFAQQLETAEAPAEILPTLAQTIAHALKIPHVAVWLPVADTQFQPVAVWGESVEHFEMLDLTYHNQTIGYLAVAPRGPNEPFTRDEEHLLQTIAALTANTVRAVQLSEELRQSRQRIVTAREEERRRLRRDLHDGLGPQLASQTLGLEAVTQLLTADPQRAQTLLTSLKAQAQEAITDIRRLVYDLRPPTLDDLGLVGAIQQSAERYETAELRITVEVPEPLPALPAAVETAVYRITQEALTNIVRHAQASKATVRLSHTAQALTVDVQDDGRGLAADHHSGVGLQSMQERAAELNGRCLIKSNRHGGTTIQAILPLEISYE